MRALIHLIIGLAIVLFLCVNWGCSYYSSLSAHKLAIEMEVRMQPQGPAPDLDSSKQPPPGSTLTGTHGTSQPAR